MADFGSICEMTSAPGVFRHQMAMLPVGRLKVLRGLGSSIQHEGRNTRLVHLVMPCRADATWHDDQPWFDGSAQHPLVYAPPGPLPMEIPQMAGVVTVVEHEALLQTALAMVGADRTASQIHAALAFPQRIAVDAEPNRRLARLLYVLYQNLEPLLLRGGDLLHHLRVDDQILRLWVLLLIPELHAASPALGSASLNDQALDHGAFDWVKELADWIAVHADRPLTLADLERQSGYSRRTLQLAFRSCLDCSPMQWVKRCRMRNARERLECPLPGDSVGSVATCAGFVNAAAFTRDFVRLYGEKPSAVLRQARRRSVAAL